MHASQKRQFSHIATPHNNITNQNITCKHIKQSLYSPKQPTSHTYFETTVMKWLRAETLGTDGLDLLNCKMGVLIVLSERLVEDIKCISIYKVHRTVPDKQSILYKCWL